MREKINPILIDIPMPILTPRLRLEFWQAGFGHAFNDMKLESRDSLKPWMIWAAKESAFEEAHSEESMRKAQADIIKREKLYMVAFERSSERMVASTGFHDINWDIPKFGIGYWVRSSVKGQGYATELTLGLLHYAFRQLNAQRVEIYHADGNDASRRVIEKTGFKLEGRLRNNDVLPDGKLVDDLMYSHIDLNDVPPLDVTWGMP